MKPVTISLPALIEKVLSPALLVFPDRVEENVDRMIRMVDGEIERLRPHVKTHKMSEVVSLQVSKGITRFKCATIAEAEMTALSGGRDVLLSHQPVGPNVARFLALQAMFPEVTFSTIVDSEKVVDSFVATSKPVRLFVDLDCGMHRTGVDPDVGALSLCRRIAQSEHLEFAGLQAYEGHLHQSDLSERTEAHAEAVACWSRLLESLQKENLSPPAIVIGGSPTFGLNAKTEWQCSPGTTLFWDVGYGRSFPDLDFECAALLLTRIISKPGKDRLCLDLGHKAVAAEKPIDKRAWFPDLPGARPLLQSEEHFVLKCPNAEDFSVGDALLAVPWHICPTVALHHEAHLVRDGKVSGETWKVAARNRILSI